jgi:hypothetical protein
MLSRWRGIAGFPSRKELSRPSDPYPPAAIVPGGRTVVKFQQVPLHDLGIPADGFMLAR